MKEMKMKNIGALILIACVSALFTPTPVQAQDVEFNYNGRVNVQGSPFSGTGQFKFSLVNKTG